jgi:hypothetical protein
MAAPTQLGTAYKIDFGAFALTGYTPEDINVESTGTQEEHGDKDGATDNVIVRNLGKQVSATFSIQDASGSLTPPAQGSTLTLTPPEGTSTAFRVVSASVRSTRGIAQLSVTLIKEVSMTYS